MTRRTFAAALLLAYALCAASSAAATPIFLVDNRPGVSNTIFRVAPATGQLTQVGTIPLSFGDALGLAAESHNVLYVTTVDAPAAHRLLRVTVSPFTIVELGALRGFYQGLVWSDGRLYGIDEGPEELWRIEPTLPASETLVGTVRLGSLAGPVLDIEGGDLAVSGTGTWYLWTNSTNDLYVLDPTTAVATQTDPATFAPLSGIAVDFQAGGALLGSSGGNDALETIDPATGATVASVPLCLACPTAYDHVFGDLASPRCTDVDGDGFAPEGGPCGAIDCDDANPTRFPGAAERCNAADDDCDGSADEEPAASASCATACTATAVCQAGACVTTPVVCDDGNPCTADACDPVAGCQFVNQPDGLSCSDGNVCTGEEVCVGGTCSDPADLNCSDGNVCTSDSCAPPDGCRNLPIAGCCTTDAECADASLCTENERCVSGQCLSDPVGCDDGNVCTNDSCNPASGCVNIAVVNGISCADGNVCNGVESCQGGICAAGTPLDCSDGNACTVDGCNPQTGCTQQPTPGCCASDADCADASACTINERCVNQACVSDPLPCNDDNACTSDGCNPASGCTFTPVPNGQSCSNLDFCDGLETCQAGACVGTPPPNCSDGNPCTTDTCSGSTGCVHTPVAGCCFVDGDCVDSDACTVNERCVGGECLSDPRNCVDGNSCTIDGCLPASGCANTPLVDGTSCSDDNACDGAETCTAALCQPGAPPDCDDRNFCTRDTCVNATGCRHEPIAGCCNVDADCSDADLCTVNERCTAAHTCASDARTCTDGDVCTMDGCEPSAGCVFTQTSGPTCDDGNPCTESDACSAGACFGVPVECQDGDLCDGREQCDALTGTCRDGTGPLVCTPGSRRADRTCSAEWYVENPNNPSGPMSSLQDCRQGDPSCDGDSSPDTCTFTVAVCFQVDDPRLSPACVPSGVAEYRLRRPSPRRDPTTANALLGVLEALPGATRTGRDGRSLTFEQPLEQLTCTALVPVVVPVEGRATIAGKTLSVDGARDSDVLKLRCLP